MRTKTYRKLPGRNWFTIGEVHRLWMGSDHLLLVTGSGFHESYKYFYFSDIQAVIVRRTGRGAGCGFFLFALFALAALSALGGEGGGRFMAGFLALVFLGATLLNLVQGQTCVTHLVTAVQTVELPSLCRVRTAGAFLGRLTPRLEAVQGRLAEGATLTFSPDGSAHTPPAPGRPAGPAELPASRGRTHERLYYVLLGNTALMILFFVFQHIAFVFPFILLGVATILLTILALIRQRGTSLSQGLKTSAWLALSLLFIRIILGQITYAGFVIKNPVTLVSYWDFLRHTMTTSPWESPWVTFVSIFDSSSTLLLGFAGLILLRNHRRRSHPAGRPK